jgi:hypothetical protein
MKPWQIMLLITLAASAVDYWFLCMMPALDPLLTFLLASVIVVFGIFVYQNEKYKT